MYFFTEGGKMLFPLNLIGTIQGLLLPEPALALATWFASDMICVQTPLRLPARSRVQLKLAWPVKLDNRVNLRAIVTGIVLRQQETETWISLSKIDFMTCGMGQFSATS